ncbi:flagellar biosynthesis anti-sigma factor FlgM [Anaerotignum sp.]|uniref:flagellar biosynthesis anti-sigma factor FlgM n=1 Tax=Anaerotignum sp. TaxID=2039241 RepID=UPI0028AA19A3|nr:flagellar biosynthesis anti-sigma factor FlgM [Anaerotignum sp.]
MKVNINNFFNMQTSSKSKEKTTQPLPQNVSTGRSRNCDEIIISGRVQKADQNRFIDELKNQISKEVNTPSSEQKIASLKQQIEEGNYQIDIDQIAKKMLLH